MRLITIIVQLVVLVLSAGFGSALAADRDRISCGKNHRISIEDLDMSPDPINRGDRVQNWRIKVHVDGSGECDTLFEIREKPGDTVVARGGRHLLHPGVNEIVIPAAQGYRFNKHETCFQVLADIERTRKAIDTKESFCARERENGKRFSMRERGDRPVPR
ncbi:MAG TPA: hypothetical protein VI231_13055 [Candidatus Binatia bacterium]|jgi:hypothetical protein